MPAGLRTFFQWVGIGVSVILLLNVIYYVGKQNANGSQQGSERIERAIDRASQRLEKTIRETVPPACPSSEAPPADQPPVPTRRHAMTVEEVELWKANP